MFPLVLAKPEPATNFLESLVLKRIQQHKVTKAVETMLQVIHGMSSVKELTLHSWDCLDLPNLLRLLPVVLAGWTAFGATLRSLTLDVTIEGCSHILTPYMVFPCLEELAIRLSMAYLTTNATKIACDILVPFVNNHHPTLQSFYLSSNNHCDVSPFLHGVCHIPHLRRLALFLPFVSIQHANTSGLQHLLESHSSVLHELTMTFQRPNIYNQPPTAIEWQSWGPLQVALPHLKSLDIDLRYFQSLPGIILYLQRFKFNPLTNLVLRNKEFSYAEVVPLMSAVGGGLKMLSLEVRYLSPQLFDLMAKKLPNLNTLSLLFDQISPFTFTEPTLMRELWVNFYLFLRPSPS
jgi:hypothetical protein